MKSPLRLGTTMTAIGFIAALTGCAMPGHHHLASASAPAAGLPTGDAALATRAMIALSSNDLPGAISLAERAADKSPRQAAIRTLLGNAYLASGRFVSAAAAYRDSLYLDASQADVLLKLALVETALGRRDEAAQLLQSGAGQIDASDLGLALALAGQPEQAVAVLEPAARAAGADARTRQNLALAYALSGDWPRARTIAAQDVPGDQLDARLHSWMALASPTARSSQVASFIGITPAAIDPGQPTRLALVEPLTGTRQASAEPIPAPAFAAPVETAPTAPVATAFVAPMAPPMADPAPVAIAVADPAPLPTPHFVAPARHLAALRAHASVRHPSLRASRPGLSLAAARLSVRPSLFYGHSKAVVQLGAYAASGRIGNAWAKAAAHNAALRRYAPVSMKFAAAHGIFYRLSVHGFRSDGEAAALCASLKRAGTSCFVRSFAGDTPVTIAANL